MWSVLSSAVLVSSLFLSRVNAQGYFTSPAGSDGSNTYTVGSTVNIAWSGTSDYPIFSLAIWSTANNTLSWIISNSEDFPVNFKWTVDVASLGFDLSSSRLFQFYACNGSDVDGTAFTIPFSSSFFNIEEASTAATTSSSTTSLNTSTASAVPTETSPPVAGIASSSATSSSSDGLSTGAKAGIGVGVSLGALAILGALAWYLIARRRRNTEKTRPMSEMLGAKDSTVSPYYDSKYNDYYAAKPQLQGSAQAIHEAPGRETQSVQLPANEPTRQPAELA